MIACLTVPAYGYEEVAVADGGSIAGSVTLLGEVPKPKGYNLTTLPDPIYCGRISDGRGWRLLQPFNVGAKGAFLCQSNGGKRLRALHHHGRCAVADRSNAGKAD
jgi:hypothetical protein